MKPADDRIINFISYQLAFGKNNKIEVILMTEKGNNIKVFVRVRPLNEMEQQIDGTNRCIEQNDDRIIKVTNFEGTGSNPYLQFTFDRVFRENCSQSAVYDSVAK